ncbi:metallophosphoesterase [Paraburkholderia caballeronis]|uniref:3',5'-cyclic AMP phosphodiesterase CpdA n=1 Tax=Paraburkholderia caballeronis TaxID=416943 RepID=A0A1H7L9Z0_9BURK|nr:metallophosphoesterase [Paraburkholderia caballeronis]PXW28338.1 3',5'-cyclic AMP phosphodiesterase CpdA [Paraburkholderia caballeronis]PXX03704.1 3',5'-cyclic AMP phosphodiesterase CpdA [Paraburkholderia caballeronis]RAK04448.1 3',5'-cyclic AMP phosphodiesterase CpdA [Paraburkholderia caballeronis]SED79790.1 3',5'-cyclic AMP phosphodiesterase CpdA [Paraburkholderia caballeronis]SEK95157.1 3',5'-cyclic AMP phosphodiesterase CpdA [Paraburkholderia caballeronis]
MKAIFVHLSDIHFGQEKNGGDVVVNEDAKQRLIEDAREEVAKLGGKASGVIVTGDIAYSGKEHEYRNAGAWLGELADAIGCERVKVQMVPGNHDMDRDKISVPIECVLAQVREKGDAILDPLLDSDEGCDFLYGRFEAYRDFALDYECELDLNGQMSSGGRLELAEGRSIKFVRLNSALICSRNDAEGTLILGKRQRVLPQEDGVEIIVLVHHPLNWFQDSATARNYLRNRARVLISGHEHFPKLQVDSVEAGRDLLLLAAGATNPDYLAEGYTYKYNILVFEWDEDADALAVTINPRTWDDGLTRFRRDDVFLDGRAERQVLGSPNFHRAPLPAVAPPVDRAVSHEAPEVKPVDIAPAAASQTDSTFAASDSAAQAPAIEQSATLDQRLLQLRFFQELPEGERLKALVNLGAIPGDLKGRLDHSMERRLFRMLIKQGKARAIEALLDLAEAKKRGDTQ